MTWVGEHYGHIRNMRSEQARFLLEHVNFTASDSQDYIQNFKHESVILSSESSQKLIQLKESDSNLDVIGLMDEHQQVLVTNCHSFWRIERIENWLSLSVFALMDDYGEDPVEIPVAFCYFSQMDERILTEFFTEMKNRCPEIKPQFIIINDHTAERCWFKVFSSCLSYWSAINIVYMLQRTLPGEFGVEALKDSISELLDFAGDYKQCHFGITDDLFQSLEMFLETQIKEEHRDEIKLEMRQWCESVRTFRYRLNLFFSNWKRSVLLRNLVNVSLPVALNSVIFYSRVELSLLKINNPELTSMLFSRP